MARNPADPIVFQLPDDDNVALITWEFVMKRLESQLGPTVQQISSTNIQLRKILDRIDYWIEQQKEDD